MRVSQLIAALEALQEKHGDKFVEIPLPDAGGSDDKSVVDLVTFDETADVFVIE